MNCILLQAKIFISGFWQTRQLAVCFRMAAAKRIGLTLEDEQQNWILRKANENGFSISTLRFEAKGLQSCLKKTEQGKFKIKHLAVNFEGVFAGK